MIEREHLERDFERRVLERTAALEEERARLEAVIENIPEGVVVVNQDGTVHLANAEALRVLRRTSMEAPELARWRELEAYHLDGRPVEPDEWPMSRTLATGEQVRSNKYEAVLQGHRIILEISTAPVMSASGEPSGCLAVFRDVTIREQAERAERDFVTNAAHELQSPLAAIVSAIEVLQAGAKDGPERDVFLTHIEWGADRLARLVRTLLVLARTQIGLEAPRDEVVELCPLLHDVRASLPSSSVELEVYCPQDLAVLTNRELVEHAVVNLAENAAKHTKEGRVVLSARELAGGVTEICVSDTGPGISAAERPRIFERFYRGDPNGAPGFGLGLAIVRAVADALGGELELDSRVGAGTIVRLRIPHAASMVGR